MMKLKSVNFHGLGGFGTLKLGELGKVTSLTGPNGSGKTSILMAVKSVFELLHTNTVSDALPHLETWNLPTEASLVFEGGSVFTDDPFDGQFNGEAGDIVIKLFVENDHFGIESIGRGRSSVSFQYPMPTRTKILQLKDDLQAGQTSRAQITLEREKVLANGPNKEPAYQVRIGALDQSLRKLNETIDKLEMELNMCQLTGFSVGDEGVVIETHRDEVDRFLSELGLPELHLVNAQAFFEESIPALIRELVDLRKGRDSESEQFDAAHGRLQRFIQSRVEIWEKGTSPEMHINGVQYKKASAGTRISLSFFGVTRLGNPNYLILWDEPENGLHPTRRAMVLKWMFDDERQFILATHAPEFIPFRSDEGKAFRCDATYTRGGNEPSLSVEHVADRRAAFSVLEALGVHPARTLFTASVVIWVEGPTELLFYRRWLGARLKRKGLLEGFHFTFMQYGGALINYLSAVDDDELVMSTFDLLSTCRHPVVLVDSDLSEEPPAGDVVASLKSGARRLHYEIAEMNKGRTKAGLFQWTSGREVENYLSTKATLYAVGKVWKGHGGFQTQLAGRPFDIGQYESYASALEQYFIGAGVVDEDNKAKGRSLWGAGNKVEMMQEALKLSGLSETDLRWGCSAKLDEIERFVLGVAETAA